MPNKFVYDQLGSLVGLEEYVFIVGTEDWPAVAVQLVPRQTHRGGLGAPIAKLTE